MRKGENSSIVHSSTDKTIAYVDKTMAIVDSGKFTGRNCDDERLKNEEK